MTFALSKRSIGRLAGIHPDLRRVVEQAIRITPVDFTVLEGVRSEKRQEELFDAGASSTMNSRHLTGHAVDLGAMVGPDIRWDWPLYYKLAEAMQKAATEQDVYIEWGGGWTEFQDGPHFQLPWLRYPKDEAA